MQSNPQHRGRNIMKKNDNSEKQTYKIGAVSKMTGIPAETLRIWERRYRVVEPDRTPAGGRLYSQRDISRLALIKRLVDAGDTISSVAALTLEELDSRAAGTRQAQSTLRMRTQGRRCRVVVLGESLAIQMKSAQTQLQQLSIAGYFGSDKDHASEVRSLEPDVLLLEMSTLHEGSGKQITDWLQATGAVHVILVYRFGNTAALAHLPASKCTILRAPVDPQMIQDQCQALFATSISATEEELDMSAISTAMVIPRKYDDETLARVALHSAAIKCECPRHLSELVASLVAFEQYSSECESQSPEDAALHAYLYNTTSRAREMIENALARVIKTEKIEI